VFARMRDGVERPDELSGMDVVGADIARSRTVEFTGRGAEDNQILENTSGSSGLNRIDGFWITAQAFTQVHAAVITERIDGDSGAGIDFLQIVVDREDQPAIRAVLTLPIVEAAIGGR